MIQLEVGKMYRTRDGSKTLTCDHFKEGYTYPYTMNNGENYLPTGKLYQGESEHNLDLVEEVAFEAEEQGDIFPDEEDANEDILDVLSGPSAELATATSVDTGTSKDVYEGMTAAEEAKILEAVAHANIPQQPMPMHMTLESVVDYLIDTASKSPSKKRKVGAILVKVHNDLPIGETYTLMATGYNYRLTEGPCEDEAGLTYEDVIHAEMDCLKNLDATFIPTGEAYETMMFITHTPCLGCRAALVARNIPFKVVKKATGDDLAEPAKPIAPPVANKVEGIAATLQQRGSVYGTFQDNSICTQSILSVIYQQAKRQLKAYELEALHMIAHKMSRIVCGPKTKKDNWHDIAGYAKLAEDLTEDQ